MTMGVLQNWVIDKKRRGSQRRTPESAAGKSLIYPQLIPYTPYVSIALFLISSELPRLPLYTAK